MGVIIDGICGLAIGDAMGVPVEFINRDILQKNPVNKMMGFGSHSVPKGTWSDDTSLTIASIDSINNVGNIDYNDIMKKFLEWRERAKYTATNEFFDIGITTSIAINNYVRGVNPINCGSDDIRSNGNGSLMRIIPFTYYSFFNNYDRSGEVDLINNASSITHGHEISKLGCLIYNDYVKSIMKGLSKDEALDNLKNNDYANYYSDASINYYSNILSGKIKSKKISDIKSSGFVVDSLEASIWCVLKTNSYREAVLQAVNLGNDTDTIGAITGSIAGIIYGYESIPEEWIQDTKRIDYLIEVSKMFEHNLTKKKIN